MNERQLNIIIKGIINAGERIKIQSEINTLYNLSKVSKYDYGIPVDLEAESIILEAIQNAKIECRIIAEESGIINNKASDYTIYIDPLDGTVNYSRGIPVYCIGLGIYKNNEPLIGIVYDINQNELLIAEKNKGITLNNKKVNSQPIKYNTLVNLEWFGADKYETAVSKLKQIGIRARTAGSGILALSYACIGRGDGAVLIENKPWDVAAGIPFALEAGYRVTQIDGSPVDLSSDEQNIIAAYPDLHSLLLKQFN